MPGFTRKDGKIRLYDGTATTPFYLELDFDEGDFSGPVAVPRPEETLVMPRGKNGPGTHYVIKSDEGIMAAQELSFTALLTDQANTENFKAWIRAMNDGAATQVNAHTLVTTKGTTQRDGVNNTPAFADPLKIACDLCYLLDNTSAQTGYRYNEVWIKPDSGVKESADGVSLSITGLVYGSIVDLTAWPTAGADVEA